MESAMDTFEDRLESYTNWPHGLILRPQVMAAAGLFHSNWNEDEVTCFHCEVSIADWDRADDPFNRHLIASPRCTFVNKSYMSSLEERLGSFHNEDTWKPGAKPLPIYMASAGFYHSNKQTDSATCYSCTLRLADWRPDDDPIQRHLEATQQETGRPCAWLDTVTSTPEKVVAPVPRAIPCVSRKCGECMKVFSSQKQYFKHKGAMHPLVRKEAPVTPLKKAAKQSSVNQLAAFLKDKVSTEPLTEKQLCIGKYKVTKSKTSISLRRVPFKSTTVPSDRGCEITRRSSGDEPSASLGWRRGQSQHNLTTEGTNKWSSTWDQSREMLAAIDEDKPSASRTAQRYNSYRPDGSHLFGSYRRNSLLPTFKNSYRPNNELQPWESDEAYGVHRPEAYEHSAWIRYHNRSATRPELLHAPSWQTDGGYHSRQSSKRGYQASGVTTVPVTSVEREYGSLRLPGWGKDRTYDTHLVMKSSKMSKADRFQNYRVEREEYIGPSKPPVGPYDRPPGDNKPVWSNRVVGPDGQAIEAGQAVVVDDAAHLFDSPAEEQEPAWMNKVAESSDQSAGNNEPSWMSVVADSSTMAVGNVEPHWTDAITSNDHPTGDTEPSWASNTAETSYPSSNDKMPAWANNVAGYSDKSVDAEEPSSTHTLVPPRSPAPEDEITWTDTVVMQDRASDNSEPALAGTMASHETSMAESEPAWMNIVA